MAKLKAPFLSLGASGSLGNTLTTSRHPSGTVAKRIPTHPDAQTLPQLYQRWRFYDANQYWLSLSSAARAVYRDQKYPRHLTPHQKCIRAYLRAPLDQVLWLRLDTPHPTTLPDYSGQGNTATAFGALSVPAFINRGRFFDGVDDKLTIPDHPSLRLAGPLTIMFWLYRDQVNDSNYLISKFTSPNRNYLLRLYDTGELAFYLSTDGTNVDLYLTLTQFNHLHSWMHFAVTFQPDTRVAIYYNAALDREFLAGIPSSYYPGAMTTSISFVPHTVHGIMDDIRIYTRPLTATHIAYIYARERYPLPS